MAMAGSQPADSVPEIDAIGSARALHRTVVDRPAKIGDEVRQRIREVLVFTPPEAVARHDDMAPEPAIVLVETGNGLALVGGQELPEHRQAVAVEMRRGARPVDRRDTRVDVYRADRPRCERRAHVTPSRSFLVLGASNALPAPGKRPYAPVREALITYGSAASSPRAIRAISSRSV